MVNSVRDQAQNRDAGSWTPRGGNSGKAVESGTEGDVVNVVNLQSKRTIQGVVIGPGQVSVVAAMPRLNTAALATRETPPAPVSRKAE